MLYHVMKCIVYLCTELQKIVKYQVALIYANIKYTKFAPYYTFLII